MQRFTKALCFQFPVCPRQTAFFSSTSSVKCCQCCRCCRLIFVNVLPQDCRSGRDASPRRPGRRFREGWEGTHAATWKPRRSVLCARDWPGCNPPSRASFRLNEGGVRRNHAATRFPFVALSNVHRFHSVMVGWTVFRQALTLPAGFVAPSRRAIAVSATATADLLVDRAGVPG